MIDPLSSFEIHTILPLNLFGLDISITNSSLFMIIATALVLMIMYVGTKSSHSLIPTKMQIIIEELFSITGGIVKTNVSQKGVEIFPYIFSMFMFIMFGNILGLFPFAFSFTSQIIVTIGMSSLVFIASIIIGLRTQGVHYFRHFCPEGIPSYIAPFFTIIELMSFLFRPISLGVRLFANMVSGHIMIKVMASFAVSIAGIAAFSYASMIPIIVNVFLNVFKLVVCILQAYVFVVISCIYLSESMEGSSVNH
ncbi:MAG: F0F1 ATP synthase subunit A [Holosporales bacterium]|nr:F0F1 ATP synthase subunit A [Holosporales bacterium]